MTMTEPLSRAEALAVELDGGLLDQAIAEMSEPERLALLYDWSFWRRRAQITPTGADWVTWLLLGGRGSGKTRPGAEEVRHRAIGKGPGGSSWGRIALVASTAADYRDVMVEGESGILAVHPRHERPLWQPSKRRLTWPNGAMAFCYSAEQPDRLRGPQHHGAWADEIGAWKRGPATWDNLLLGLRLGQVPQVVATTTPKPLRWLRALIEDPTTVLSHMSTYENAANLAPTFLRRVLARYEGSRLAAQEIAGLMLEDVLGALWTVEQIESARIDLSDDAGVFARHLLPDFHDLRVVGVDPPGSALGVCGIVVAGRHAATPKDRPHADILDDRSMSGQPEEWGRAVLDARDAWGAQEIVVERNFGGDMVRSTIHSLDPRANVVEVRASDSKKARAQPIAVYYDQDRIHHVGIHADLESEQTTWVPPKTLDPETGEDIGAKWSPNRLDAMVWAVTRLLPPLAIAAGSAKAPSGSGASRRAPTGARISRAGPGSRTGRRR